MTLKVPEVPRGCINVGGAILESGLGKTGPHCKLLDLDAPRSPHSESASTEIGSSIANYFESRSNFKLI